MSLSATNAQVYKGTAAVTYGSGSGVSGSELKGTATITYGGAPTSNTAVSFPGSSGNYLNLGSTHPGHFDPTSSNVFVECWVYFNSLTAPNTTQMLCTTSSGAGSEDMGLWVYTPSQSIVFRMWNTSGQQYGAQVTGALPSAGVWYHMAGSWDYTTKKVYAFRNGVLGDTINTLVGTLRYTAGASLQFGASELGTFYPFNGYMRDFRIVRGGTVPTTSFTPAAAPFGSGTPTYVLGMGTPVLSLYDRYFFPSWLNLPGVNGSYTALGATNPSNFDTSGTNFFVECWVYMKSIPASGTVQYIILRGTGVFGVEDIGMRIMPTGFVQFYSYGAGNTIALPDTGVALSVNKWYHLAGSIVSSTKTVYIFLDGVLKNSASMAGAPRTTAGSNFYIGTPTIANDWVATNAYIQDLRVTRGGTVPTATFTPAAAPFGLASPSYVSGGTTVLSLATQYYQTGMTIKTNNSPDIYLAPTGSYPTFNSTGGTAPTFLSDRVRFNPGAVLSTSPSCQYVDFGPQTFPMTTTGFSFAVRFQFTGTAGAWERIFSINPGGTNPVFEFFRNSNTNILIMGYFNPSQNEVAHYGSYSQNTTYTVIGVYDPNAGTFGTLYYYFNGTLVATYATTAKLANFTSTNTYIGTSKDGAAALNADIFYAAMYKRVLRASEITAITASGPSFGPTPIEFRSRPILPPVLVNPGNQYFTSGTITVTQTALQPVNGITWSLNPIGSGVAISSSTDYALNLAVASGYNPGLYTISATNKVGVASIIQINISPTKPPLIDLSSTAITSSVGLFSLKSLLTQTARVLNIRRSTDNVTQDFYADTSGNLTVSAGSGQTMASWLGAATGYITTWYSQSANSNNATQSNTTLQPKIDLTNKQIDFKPNLYFVMPNGTVPYGNSNYTMVVKHNTITGTYNEIIGSGTYNQTAGWCNALEKQGAGGYSNYWWGNDLNFSPYNVGNIITAKYDNTVGRRIYINGTSVASDTNTNRNSTAIQNTIGTAFRGGDGQSGISLVELNGELYYVCLFNTPLSDADRTVVEAIPIS